MNAKRTKGRLSKETKVMFCFRIDKDLRRRMKSYVASKDLIVQSWLEELIEKNIKENNLT